MIFAFLFGLSMDYEVFTLSRMREAHDETGSTDRAIQLGLRVPESSSPAARSS
jgi:RND superfamily putative drug exporter